MYPLSVIRKDSELTYTRFAHCFPFGWEKVHNKILCAYVLSLACVSACVQLQSCEIECVFVYNFVIACVLLDQYVNTKIGDTIFTNNKHTWKLLSWKRPKRFFLQESRKRVTEDGGGARTASRPHPLSLTFTRPALDSCLLPFVFINQQAHFVRSPLLGKV